MELDFNKVKFDNVIPLQTSYRDGNNVFDLPILDTNKPTVKNQGNVDLMIGVTGGILTEPVNQQTIAPQYLSVHVLGTNKVDLTNEVIIPDGNLGYLKPCTPTQIDFDLTPPGATGQGVYSGTMNIRLVRAL